MKFTAERSEVTGKISRYIGDQTIAGKKAIIRQRKTDRGTWWSVEHKLAGGHVFDYGHSTHSTLAEAKAHAQAMLEELGN